MKKTLIFLGMLSVTSILATDMKDKRFFTDNNSLQEVKQPYYFSTSSNAEQSKEEGLKKVSKKGRIIGTIIGTGIGLGGSYMYLVVCGLSGLSEDRGENEKPSPLYIIIPPVLGGTIGYVIGKAWDFWRWEKALKKEEKR